MQKSVEPLSDHPLFRALVLMGGGLAIGCGGVAQGGTPDRNDIGSTGSPSGGAASSTVASVAGMSSVGGSAITIGIPVAGGATQSAAGAPGTVAAAYYNPSCPYQQWDCSGVPPSACYFYLKSKDDPQAAGCVCDSSRPTHSSACKADENFVCLQAYPPYVEAQPGPSTWDGSLHVQCACVPSPVPTYDNCQVTCATAFSRINQRLLCSIPHESTCDEHGVCTATSADVLRQDGIMCGCADIGLK
jgi:hypothetical protein